MTNRIYRYDIVEPSKEAYDALIAARAQVIMGYPWLGYFITSAEYHFTNDIPTMAALPYQNRNIVLINEKCFMNMLENDRQRNFGLVHELEHLFFMHGKIRVDLNLNRKLWGIATDYFINGHIHDFQIDQKRGSKYFEVPEWVYFREDLKGKSSLEIYEQLLEENDNDIEKAIKNNGGDPDGSSPGGGDKTTFDEILDIEEGISESHRAMNEQIVNAAVIHYQSSANNTGIGDMPSNMMKDFMDLIISKVHWREHLSEFVVEACKSDYSYNVFNHLSGEVIYPGMEGDFIRVLFGVDSSGSMTIGSRLTDCLSEIQGVISAFDEWELNVISCDTAAHSVGQYSSDDTTDFGSEILSVMGFGGTELSPMIRYVEEMDEAPSVIILATDGEIPTDPVIEAIDEIGIPTIILVTDDGNKNLDIPNAKIIHMEEQ